MHAFNPSQKIDEKNMIDQGKYFKKSKFNVAQKPFNNLIILGLENLWH